MMILLLGAALATGQPAQAAAAGQGAATPAACDHAITTKGGGTSGRTALAIKTKGTSAQRSALAIKTKGTGAQRTALAIKTKGTGAQRGAVAAGAAIACKRADGE